MRYNKGDINSAINAAIETVKNTGKTHWVYPTANGYAIASQLPNPFSNNVRICWNGEIIQNLYIPGEGLEVKILGTFVAKDYMESPNV